MFLLIIVICCCLFFVGLVGCRHGQGGPRARVGGNGGRPTQSPAAARCSKGHVDANNLVLEAGQVGRNNVLVVILSHRGAAHHHSETDDEQRMSLFIDIPALSPPPCYGIGGAFALVKACQTRVSWSSMAFRCPARTAIRKSRVLKFFLPDSAGSRMCTKKLRMICFCLFVCLFVCFVSLCCFFCCCWWCYYSCHFLLVMVVVVAAVVVVVAVTAMTIEMTMTTPPTNQQQQQQQTTITNNNHK